MKVGIPKETAAGERRVALTPDAPARLSAAGIELLVEAGAGTAAGFLDSAFAEAGARIVPDAATLYARGRPRRQGAAALRRRGRAPARRPGARLPARSRSSTLTSSPRSPPAARPRSRWTRSRRISRAQSMDALSSQATVAGYKAVLLAATSLGKFFPMLTTAAGTIPPARVLVLGAGVAGLQAIATARRLGAVVSAFDTRPVVREQVESLGATFLELEIEGGETAGGYATELSEEQHRREQELIASAVARLRRRRHHRRDPGQARARPDHRGGRALHATRIGDRRPGRRDRRQLRAHDARARQSSARASRSSATPGCRARCPRTPAACTRATSRACSSTSSRTASSTLDFDDEITRGTCVAHAGRVLERVTA